MKKIVPFTKDISFDTSIYEIHSISLEHTLSLKENNNITGEFIISGSYKMTEASINIDEFNYNIPFEISIDKKYDTKNLIVDINDFYYEIIDNKILSINIEVAIDNLEEKIVKEEIEMLEETRNDGNISQKNTLEEKIEDAKIEENIEKSSNNREEIVSSIFDDLDNNENYVTYKVHIVTENDTIESILQKYEISSSKLEAYNNLMDIKIGDKIIIPTND